MNIAKANPKQNNLEKLLLDIAPILKIRIMIIEYKINNPSDPINPNSSEYKVKIKSVCFSGKNSK